MKIELFVDRFGVLRGVYRDELRGILEDVEFVVERATSVEFDRDSQQWVAVLKLPVGQWLPGTVIARTETRQQALFLEEQFMAENLQHCKE